jgi:hypothetical protein
LTTQALSAFPAVHIAPGISPAGYIPLDQLGVAPIRIGDEEIINLDVPSFLFNGLTLTRIGIDSNGYLIVDGGDPLGGDNNCCNLEFGPARPNGILAPFWTDLDGGGVPGIFTADVTDGVNSWRVVEWRVNISYTYDPATLAPPFGQPFLIGVENMDGSSFASIPLGTVPSGDLVVTSDSCETTPPTLTISVSPPTLSPANHRYVTVKATTSASDNADPSPTVALVSVTSNEPDNGLDDGDTAHDIVIVNDHTFQLRAERSGTGTGRVYTITYKATDACGNQTTTTATVKVPIGKK